MMISIGMVGGGEGKEEQREKEGGEGKEVRKTGIGIGAWGGKKKGMENLERGMVNR